MSKSEAVQQIEDYLGIVEPPLGEYRQVNGQLEVYAGNDSWIVIGRVHGAYTGTPSIVITNGMGVDEKGVLISLQRQGML